MTRALRRGLALALLGLAPLLVKAHKPSDAYLALTVRDDGRIEQRLDVALRDANRELALDADSDGALTWREIRTRWDALERMVDESVVVRADRAPCARESAGSSLLDEHVDGRYAVLRRTLRCPGGAAAGRLEIDYRLFAQSDPTHRGIARIEVAGRQSPLTRVLVPGEPAAEIALGASGRPLAGGGFGAFFADGLHHIAVGADHLLFLVTLLMVAVWRREGREWVPRAAAASGWREALRLVTAFTVAHSLTLGLAASGVLAPPSRWVESLIAISVFVAAIDNLRPFLPGPRWMTVAAFGLVHGFGFAGPLQDLGLRGADIAAPLLGFNLGVEAGQVVVVGVLLPLLLLVRHRQAYRRWVVRPGSGLVALVALAWTAERALALPLPLLPR